MFKIPNLTFKEGLKYVQSIRPSTNPNEGFKVQLMMFEEIMDICWNSKYMRKNVMTRDSERVYEVLKDKINRYVPDFKTLNKKFPEITLKKYNRFWDEGDKFFAKKKP
jgi:hypothetical protein